MRFRWRRLVGVAMGVVVVAAPASAAAASRTVVPGSAPSWAKASRDRGVVAGDQSATVTVYLPLRGAAAASSLLDQVSDPTSSSYGQYLTPDQFRQRFAASDADVAAVTSFLRGAGFTVSNGPTYNNHVSAKGTIAQANAAFATTVHRYAYRGHLLNAPNGQLSVPASLNGKVLAVTGLDQTLARPAVRHDRPARWPPRTRLSPRPRATPARPVTRRRRRRSSTRRRARPTSARRWRRSTRRSTAARCRSRRAATRPRSPGRLRHGRLDRPGPRRHAA